MNILLLTQVVPFPPHSGPRIKTYYVLQHLLRHHQVTLVTFTRDAEEEAHAASLRSLGVAVHTVHLRRSRWRDGLALLASLFTRRPFLIERDASKAMRQLVEHLVFTAALCARPYDCVHADQLNMAQFALPLPLLRLLDQHNAVWTILERMAGRSRGLKQLFLRREQRLLQRYEGHVCMEFEAVTVVSERDRQALLQVMPRPRHIPVVPIGIDVQGQPPVQRAPSAKGVLSVATMMYPPNVDALCWFAREVYPLVQQAVPDTVLYVCGPRPVAAVRALADENLAVQVTGYVPDVRPYIEQSACFIVPLHSGGGMRVKILQALAWGIPIVSTTVGYEGIDLVPGEHLLVADTPDAFAAAVTRLLHEPALGTRLAEAGRRRLLERYDWRTVCPALDAVYASLQAGHHRHPAEAFPAPWLPPGAS